MQVQWENLSIWSLTTPVGYEEAEQRKHQTAGHSCDQARCLSPPDANTPTLRGSVAYGSKSTWPLTRPRGAICPLCEMVLQS